MEQDDLIISIYLCIEETYNHLTADKPLRRGGFAPALTDAEVLTMEIIGEMQGCNGDRAIWRYFRRHWQAWFPKLGAYKTFAKHCANLCWIKQAILAHLFPPVKEAHIIDSLPLPLCHNARAKRSRMLDDVAGWGYCAAKETHYYGLKGHLVINTQGFVTAMAITPPPCDDRQVLWDFADQIKGWLIGDKGYLGKGWQKDMAAMGINLQTPLRSNMVDHRPKWFVKSCMKLRKRIETTFSLLTEQFALTKIKAHDLWHYTSKFTRKILAYNFYILLGEKS